MSEYTIMYAQRPTSWGASVPDLPGCLTVGATREETERVIRSAIESHIEVLRELGQPIREPRYEAGKVTIAA